MFEYDVTLVPVCCLEAGKDLVHIRVDAVRIVC